MKKEKTETMRRNNTHCKVRKYPFYILSLTFFSIHSRTDHVRIITMELKIKSSEKDNQIFQINLNLKKLRKHMA